MRLAFTPELQAFRSDVRQWLAEHLPPALANDIREGRSPDRDAVATFWAALDARGWTAPGWPVEHGGTDWPLLQRHVFDVECRLANAPPVHGQNINMVGQAIIKYGTPAQQARFLDATRSGRMRWTQGYSENGAGSDLAQVQTRAVRDGDHYRVTGAKTWTSGAEHADWIFLLARTDPDAKPQRGISFLLVDLRSPGVTVEPLYAFNGKRLWNQVYFDDVVVPVDQRLGDEHAGWTVAKTLLGDERLMLSRVSEDMRLLANLRAVAAGPDGDHQLRAHAFQRQVAELTIRLEALEATSLRMLTAADAGTALGAEPSMLKLKGSELIQAMDRALVEAVGHWALPQDRANLARRQQDEGGNRGAVGPASVEYAASGLFHHRGYTIAGGTSEVQKNIIASAVLGL